MYSHVIKCFPVTISLLLLCAVIACSDDLGEQEQSFAYQLLLSQDANLDKDSEYIVVIGDIQEYTSANGQGCDIYYMETLNWVLSQYAMGIKIKCILQTGDITNSNARIEYDIFNKYTLPIIHIPYIACIGNHDYTWNSEGKITNRYSTLFSEYFSKIIPASLIVSQFEEGRMENIVVKNEIMNKPYYILALEFGARSDVVDWANNYVKQNPDIKFILLTHEYLSAEGVRISSRSYSEKQFVNTTWSSPEQLWKNLVQDNNNIACVLCGHNGFYARQFSKNSYGRLVPQLLFNLQYQKNGGNGLVMLWEFPQGSDSVNIGIYNTISRTWYEDSSNFKIRYKY